METLARIAARLHDGAETAAELLTVALARIDAPDGQGFAAFTRVYGRTATAEAQAIDLRRAAGVALGPLAGMPIAIKDLFDVAGEPTAAGSTVLQTAPPAKADAAVVRRLRRAGAVIVGKTNMSEFAFSGLGLNPHCGTPLNPWDRLIGRLPGGSSSGAAVAVADGMCAAAVGTDTGGSTRIPAAFCGLVGFKPTARRVPLAGCLPLSPTLDSIGPIARSVACAARLDAVLAGEQDDALPPLASLPGLRLLVPKTYVLDGLDAHVAAAFDGALRRLSLAGVRVVEQSLPFLAELPRINGKGGFPAAEAYHWHRELLARAGKDYDPRVRARIERGAGMTAADYLDLVAARADLIDRAERALAGFDAIAFPTTPIVAPRLADVAADDDFARLNLLALRNPSLVNFLDGCALSLPCQRPGEAPVGLTLAGLAGRDHAILSLGRAVEAVLKS